jgi:hypothetical protein
MEIGELSEFFGQEIVERYARFVAVCLLQAHLHDRGIQFRPVLVKASNCPIS